MKKILALLLVLAMALSLVACGGEKEAAAEAPAASDFKVAMISDYAGITDQVRSACAGCQRDRYGYQSRSAAEPGYAV